MASFIIGVYRVMFGMVSLSEPHQSHLKYYSLPVSILGIFEWVMGWKLLSIKTGIPFLWLAWLFLAVFCACSTDLSGDTIPDSSSYCPQLSVPGVSVSFPLNLEDVGAAAVVQLAVSSAIVISALVCQGSAASCSPVIYPVMRVYGISAGLLNRFLLIDALRQWASWLVFSGSQWNPVRIPDSATAEAGTFNPVLGYLTLAEADPNYRIQHDNFASLHSLVAYVTELNKQLAPGQSVVKSRDGKAELQVVQQDSTTTVFSVILPNSDNTTSTYQVGSNRGIFWIKKINDINVERYQQVVWSEPKEGSTTTCLTVQLIAPEKANESGLQIALTVPSWLTHRLLAASSAKTTAGFSRLFLNWYWSAYIMSEPMKALMLRPYQELGLQGLTPVVPACYSDNQHCFGWMTMQAFSAGPVPQSYILGPAAEENRFSSSGESFTLNKSDEREPEGSGEDEGEGAEGEKDKDKGAGSPFSEKSGLSPVASAESLLWQATKQFFLNSGLSVGQSPEAALQDAYDLMRKLSHAGMLQVLPVEDRQPTEDWAMVVSNRLARYINHSMSPAGDTDPPAFSDHCRSSDDEYIVPMTQVMFNRVVDSSDKYGQFAQTIINLRDGLKDIIEAFCVEKKTGSCLYGGESVRAYITKHGFGHQLKFKDNEPVTNDIDVLMAYDKVDDLKQWLDTKLDGFKVSEPRQKMLFSFPGQGPDPEAYNLFVFDFTVEGGSINAYLPSLDVAMALTGSQATFQSEELVIYESIVRGLNGDAAKRDTSIRKQGKHWHRALYLKTVFSKNYFFSMLLDDIDRRSGELPLQPNHRSTHFKSARIEVMKERIDELTRELNNKEQELMLSKQKVLDALKANEISLAKKEEQRNQFFHEFEKKLSRKDKEIADRRSANKRMGEKIASLNKLAKSYEEKNVSLDKELKSLEQQLKKIKQDQAQDKSEEIDGYKEKISQLDLEVLDIKRKLEVSNTKYTDLQADNEWLQNEVSEYKKRHKKLLGDYNEASKNLKKSIEAFSHRLDENDQLTGKKTKRKAKLKGSGGYVNEATGRLFYRGFVVGIATYIGYNLRGIPMQESASDGIGSLCLDLDDYTGLNRDILKTMCGFDKSYRVVDYQIYSFIRKKLALNFMNKETFFENQWAQKIKKGSKFLLAHARHYQLSQMTKKQLLQVVGGIRAGKKSVGDKLSLNETITGVVDYCGLMPDIKWQYDCGRKAVQRMLSKQLENEYYVVVNGRRDIKLENPDRVINFLPVWDITSDQLGWYDVWPYRLDKEGYTILGNSNSKQDTTLVLPKCPGELYKDIQLKVFTDFKWHIKGFICSMPTEIKAKHDSVYWWNHDYPEAHRSTAGSKDEKGLYHGAWKDPDK